MAAAFIVNYHYALKSWGLMKGPKIKSREFGSKSSAWQYTQQVKAHALSNPDLRFVDLLIGTPIPDEPKMPMRPVYYIYVGMQGIDEGKC